MTIKMIVFLFGVCAIAQEHHSTSGNEKKEPHYAPTFSSKGGSGYFETLFSMPIRNSPWGIGGGAYRAMKSTVIYVGPEYSFKAKGFTLAPGLGLLFGQREPVPGSFGTRLRVQYESKHERFFGEFSGIQGLSSFRHTRDTYIVSSLGFRFGCGMNERRCKLMALGEHLGHRAAEEPEYKETEDQVGLGTGIPVPKVPWLEATVEVLVPTQGKPLDHPGVRLGINFAPKR